MLSRVDSLVHLMHSDLSDLKSPILIQITPKERIFGFTVNIISVNDADLE